LAILGGHHQHIALFLQGGNHSTAFAIRANAHTGRLARHGVDKAGAGFGGVFFDVGGVHGEFLIGPPAWLGRGVLVFLYVTTLGLLAIY